MPAISAHAQQPASAPSIVFDGVTVIDVQQGKRTPNQRVVVVGNRIQSMGAVGSIKVPPGAQVVDSKGKYLIPGLWDMHVHPRRSADVFYPLFIANGVTGIRDAGSEVPLDTLRLWRREILAGTRIGPPRQLLSGQSIAGPDGACKRNAGYGPQTCVADSADAVHYVDSLKAAGADMIKPRAVSPAIFFAVAAEARRLGISFGGHADSAQVGELHVSPLQASDSGATIVDHEIGEQSCWRPKGAWHEGEKKKNFEQCKELAQHFRRNGTWFVPTLARTDVLRGPRGDAISKLLTQRANEFWGGSLLHGNWLRDSAAGPVGDPGSPPLPLFDSTGAMYFTQATDLPLMAGTDDGAPVLKQMPPGFTLHAELTMNVVDGVTPLNALQSATLNPARFLHATDSLGTVEAGKLADLVLLDADPLNDISNTTTIRAVVANGRYFDRAALDKLLVEAQTKVK